MNHIVNRPARTGAVAGALALGLALAGCANMSEREQGTVHGSSPIQGRRRAL